MANQHKHPNRSFRPPPDDWTAFEKAAIEQGTNRQALLNAFIAWFIGRPDAHLPERPTPQEA
ncbi:hypothetical protein F4561_002620 [Lipingzhangella halophila]|uniref:Uncharacterized protein n=1 Tax=Lipingzhangella halophila TaxID=1783352 RepID=A0A7W7W3J8_9ACTN|nr:hypothetical protein [Lipingzhangella halophila]MBB4931800.1 hypothetical protein [Lipingzhangella halophila]